MTGGERGCQVVNGSTRALQTPWRGTAGAAGALRLAGGPWSDDESSAWGCVAPVAPPEPRNTHSFTPVIYVIARNKAPVDGAGQGAENEPKRPARGMQQGAPGLLAQQRSGPKTGGKAVQCWKKNKKWYELFCSVSFTKNVIGIQKHVIELHTFPQF